MDRRMRKMNSKKESPTTSPQPSVSLTEADLSQIERCLVLLSEIVMAGATAPYMIPLGAERKPMPNYDLFPAKNMALISANVSKRRKRPLGPRLGSAYPGAYGRG